ncbi:MAG: hypothetical protein OEX16_00280 [Hadesarchaea archaeon]|nr:hypothetical protein [Hadesarchaea archaeon]MDH5685537.1 hypothetical protein [Hadesarchaea archaeon]
MNWKLMPVLLLCFILLASIQQSPVAASNSENIPDDPQEQTLSLPETSPSVQVENNLSGTSTIVGGPENYPEFSQFDSAMERSARTLDNFAATLQKLFDTLPRLGEAILAENGKDEIFGAYDPWAENYEQTLQRLKDYTPKMIDAFDNLVEKLSIFASEGIIPDTYVPVLEKEVVRLRGWFDNLITAADGLADHLSRLGRDALDNCEALGQITDEISNSIQEVRDAINQLVVSEELLNLSENSGTGDILGENDEPEVGLEPENIPELERYNEAVISFAGVMDDFGVVIAVLDYILPTFRDFGPTESLGEVLPLYEQQLSEYELALQTLEEVLSEKDDSFSALIARFSNFAAAGALSIDEVQELEEIAIDHRKWAENLTAAADGLADQLNTIYDSVTENSNSSCINIAKEILNDGLHSLVNAWETLTEPTDGTCALMPWVSNSTPEPGQNVTLYVKVTHDCRFQADDHRITGSVYATIPGVGSVSMGSFDLSCGCSTTFAKVFTAPQTADNYSIEVTASYTHTWSTLETIWVPYYITYRWTEWVPIIVLVPETRYEWVWLPGVPFPVRIAYTVWVIKEILVPVEHEETVFGGYRQEQIRIDHSESGNVDNSVGFRVRQPDVTSPTSHVNLIEPYLQFTTPFDITATASDPPPSSTGVSYVTLYYRHSTDDSTWTSWICYEADHAPPWKWSFTAPKGGGYYEFYSIARDRTGNVEKAPEVADAICSFAQGDLPTNKSSWENTLIYAILDGLDIIKKVTEDLKDIFAKMTPAGSIHTPDIVHPVEPPEMPPAALNPAISIGDKFLEGGIVTGIVGGSIATFILAKTISPPVPFLPIDPLEITIIAYDPSGIKHPLKVVPNTNIFVYTEVFPTPGIWTIEVRAENVPENFIAFIYVIEGKFSSDVGVDINSPVSKVDTITPYWQNADTVPFAVTATASDRLSIITSVELFYRYSSDNLTWGPWIPYGIDNVEPYEWLFDAPEGDGYYEFYSIAMDVVSNAEEAPEQADTRAAVDTTPPVSTVNPIEPYWQNAGMIPFGVTATATDTIPPSGAIPSSVKQVELYYRFSLDNLTWGSWIPYEIDDENADGWSWMFDYPLKDGYYEFYTVATDIALNVETPPDKADAQAGVDTASPISIVDTISPYWWNATMVTFNITTTAEDPIPAGGAKPSGLKQVELFYRYSLDNLTWGSWKEFAVDIEAPWSWSFDVPQGDGYYEFYTIATDMVLNVETPPEEADVKVGTDTLPPISSLNPIEPYWHNTSMLLIEVTAVASDPVPLTGAVPSGLGEIELYYRYSPDNFNWSDWALYATDNKFPYAWQFDPPKDDGYYEFYSIAIDMAKNVETAPEEPDERVGVDTNPPDSSVDSTDPYWREQFPFSISVTATDDWVKSEMLIVGSGMRSVELYYRSSIDNVNWTEWRLLGTKDQPPYSWSFDAPDGCALYEFYSIATDVVGNVEEAPEVADAACGVIIPATIDIDPNTLNLKGEGRWITVYIELPGDYDLANVGVATMMLESSIQAEPRLTEIGDHDGDGIPDLMIKFDRSAVQSLVSVGDVELVITSKWRAVLFKGSDIIRVIEPGRGQRGNRPEVPPGQSDEHPGKRFETPPGQSGEHPSQEQGKAKGKNK